MLPLVPVTVIVDVVVRTANPVLELLQPVSAVAAPSKTRNAHIARPFALRRRSHANPRQARDAAPGIAPGGVPERLALGAGMVIVRVLLNGVVVPGTTLAGAKLALAPSGRPAAESVTASVKGLSALAEVSCTVYCTLVPR